MFKVNPYRPGVGLMPTYLAGRDVGKTVLINKLQKIAEDKDIFCRHIEVEARNDFISQIAACAQAFLRTVSAKEKFKHLISKPLEAIKSLIVSFNPNDNTFSLSLQWLNEYKEWLNDRE